MTKKKKNGREPLTHHHHLYSRACIPYHSVLSRPCSTSSALPKLQLDVDIATDSEIDGPRLPAIGQDDPHRLESLDVVLLIAASVRHTKKERSIEDPTRMAVHLSWSTHERRKWSTFRGHKMAVLP